MTATYTQAQVDQAFDACCANPGELTAACQDVCHELPGVPVSMLVVAALAQYSTLTPIDIVKSLAGAFPPDQILAALLSSFPGLQLDDAVSALLNGEKQQGIYVTPLVGQQALATGVSSAAASASGSSLAPPIPVVSAGGSARWITPLYDPAMSGCDLAYVPGGAGGGAAALVAVTGSWVNFLDPVSGEVTAVVQGGQWERKSVVDSGIVYALDAVSGAIHALRPDGSEVWRDGASAGELAADGGSVFQLSSSDGSVQAFNGATGASLWSVGPSGSPNVRAIGAGAGKVVVLSDVGGITVSAFDAATGSPAWTWQPPQDWGAAARWIPESTLKVTADGVVMVPLNPFQAFLRAADGTLLSSYSNTNQQSASLFWSEPDTQRGTVVMGWDGSLAYEVWYLAGANESSFFPSIGACTGNQAPDPSTNGPVFPITSGDDLLVTFATGDTSQVGLVGAAALSMNENDLTMSQRYAIDGWCSRPVSDGSTLYLPTFTGQTTKSIQWIAALPL